MTRSTGSWVRRSRPALGLRRFCADSDPRFAVFPLRPSSDGATRRRSSLAVQPSTGSYRVALPASTGASPGFSAPGPSRIFSAAAREPSSACDFPPEELARALAACRRLLPRGLPAVGDGRLRATSLALSVLAAEVACARRFRVSFAVGGRFLFRSRDPLSRSLVRRRTARQERHTTHVAIARQAAHTLSTIAGTPIAFSCRALETRSPRFETFHTAIHSLWEARRRREDVAHSIAAPAPAPVARR